jgi:hypothetical protein
LYILLYCDPCPKIVLWRWNRAAEYFQNIVQNTSVIWVSPPIVAVSEIFISCLQKKMGIWLVIGLQVLRIADGYWNKLSPTWLVLIK